MHTAICSERRVRSLAHSVYITRVLTCMVVLAVRDSVVVISAVTPFWVQHTK